MSHDADLLTRVMHGSDDELTPYEALLRLYSLFYMTSIWKTPSYYELFFLYDRGSQCCSWFGDILQSDDLYISVANAKQLCFKKGVSLSDDLLKINCSMNPRAADPLSPSARDELNRAMDGIELLSYRLEFQPPLTTVSQATWAAALRRRTAARRAKCRTEVGSPTGRTYPPAPSQSPPLFTSFLGTPPATSRTPVTPAAAAGIGRSDVWVIRCKGAMESSPDFAVVKCGEAEYKLPDGPKAVLAFMVSAYELGRNSFTKDELIDAAGSSSSRADDAVGRVLWKRFVVPDEGRRGRYKLIFPPAAAANELG